MNEFKELYDKLTQGERKLIAQQLKKDGKTQLIEIYNQLKSGASIDALYQNTNASKLNTSLLSHQLKEFMTKELANSKRASVIEIKFRNGISEIEFLKSKFLNNQALKKINKLKSKLLEHERYTYLQELILIEIEIQYFLLSEQDFKLKLEFLLEEYDLYKIKNAKYYAHKTHFYKQLAGIHNKDEEMKNYQSLDSTSTNNRSAHYFNMRSKLIDHLTSGELTKAESVADMLLNFTVLNKHEMDRVPFQKLDVYFMSGLAYLLRNNQFKFLECLAELESIYTAHDILEIKFEERFNYLKWVGVAIGYIECDENILLDRYAQIKNVISLEFEHRIIEQISNCYIQKSHYIKANKWNREILNKSKKNQREEFYKCAEIRAIYISILNNRHDNTDTLVARFVSDKEKLKNYDNNLVVLLKSGKLQNPALLRELSRASHFWKFAISIDGLDEILDNNSHRA